MEQSSKFLLCFYKTAICPTQYRVLHVVCQEETYDTCYMFSFYDRGSCNGLSVGCPWDVQWSLNRSLSVHGTKCVYRSSRPGSTEVSVVLASKVECRSQLRIPGRRVPVTFGIRSRGRIGSRSSPLTSRNIQNSQFQSTTLDGVNNWSGSMLTFTG